MSAEEAVRLERFGDDNREFHIFYDVEKMEEEIEERDKLRRLLREAESEIGER